MRSMSGPFRWKAAVAVCGRALCLTAVWSYPADASPCSLGLTRSPEIGENILHTFLATFGVTQLLRGASDEINDASTVAATSPKPLVFLEQFTALATHLASHDQMSDPSLLLEVARIKERDDLPTPPFPHPPDLATGNTPIKAKLKLVQGYITSLEYNYTGEAFFVKKKDRRFLHVTSTAKLIIREALPIQCVEAVFLGAYLTADIIEMDRYPICFRSSLDGRVYRHIVLAVRCGGTWGALGLSRRDSLMYKELRYPSLSKLVEDYRESYTANWHLLERASVGFPLPHDMSSNIPVKWKVLRVDVKADADWEPAARDLDRFVACAPHLFERFSSTGTMPDHPLVDSSASSTADATQKSDGDGSGHSNRNSAGNGACPNTRRGNAQSLRPGVDSKSSPGVLSPGPRSPGAPCYWSGPARTPSAAGTPTGVVGKRGGSSGGGGGGGGGGGRGGRGGGRRRRASTSVGRPIAAKDDRNNTGGDGGGDAVIIASPPRARIGSARPGGKCRAATSKYPDKHTRRRTSTSITKASVTGMSGHVDDGDERHGETAAMASAEDAGHLNLTPSRRRSV